MGWHRVFLSAIYLTITAHFLKITYRSPIKICIIEFHFYVEFIFMSATKLLQTSNICDKITDNHIKNNWQVDAHDET